MTDAERPKENQFDVVIVGGGMVGASMACALASLPIKIAIVEAYPFRSNNQPSYDARSIALAYGSKIIFETLGLWESLQQNATPIKHIHVSSKGQFGVTRLHATDENLEALGYVIENRLLGNSLVEKLNQYANVHLICPAKLNDLSIHDDYAELNITQDNENISLQSKLVIGADGGNSKVREIINVPEKTKAYKQTAIISNVTPGKPHDNIAYERFTNQGPIALLPMSDNRCSLVLTVNDENKDEVMAMDDVAFLQYLEKRFGFRTGGFTKTSKRHAYPLSLMRIEEHYKPRVVIIGNAAHTLHPIAGQGFNLGLRDVAVLADTLANAIDAQQDIGETAVLENYAKLRNKDQKKVAFITDSLAKIYSNDFFPLTKARSQGLTVTDLMPSIKHRVAKEAMGLVGKLPKLSRGLPL